MVEERDGFGRQCSESITIEAPFTPAAGQAANFEPHDARIREEHPVEGNAPQTSQTSQTAAPTLPQDINFRDVEMQLQGLLQQPVPKTLAKRSRSLPSVLAPAACLPEKAPTNLGKFLTGVVETACQAYATALHSDVERGHQQLAGRMEALFGAFEKRMVDLLTKAPLRSSDNSPSLKSVPLELGEVSDLWKRRLKKKDDSPPRVSSRTSPTSGDKSPKRIITSEASGGDKSPKRILTREASGARSPKRFGSPGKTMRVKKSFSWGQAKDKDAMAEGSNGRAAKERGKFATWQHGLHPNGLRDDGEPLGVSKLLSGSCQVGSWEFSTDSPSRQISRTDSPSRQISLGERPSDKPSDKVPVSAQSSVLDVHAMFSGRSMNLPSRRNSLLHHGGKRLSIKDLDDLNSLAILSDSGLTNGGIVLEASAKYGSKHVAVCPEQDARGADACPLNGFHVKGHYSPSSPESSRSPTRSERQVSSTTDVVDEDNSTDDGHDDRYVAAFASEQAEEYRGEDVVKMSVCVVEKEHVSGKLREDLVAGDTAKSFFDSETGRQRVSGLGQPLSPISRAQSSGMSRHSGSGMSSMDALREEQEKDLLFSQAFSLSKMERTPSGRLLAEATVTDSGLGWLPVLMLKFAGIIPFVTLLKDQGGCSIVFFWAKNCTTIGYFHTMMLLALASFIGSIWCLGTQDGSQHKNVISACFSMSAVIGLSSLRANNIDRLIGPSSMPLEKYARSFNFMREWSSSSVLALITVATLWIVIVLARGAIAFFGETILRCFQRPCSNSFIVEDSPLSFLCFTHVSCLYVMLLYTKLHIILGLEFALDAFCLRFVEHGDLPRCVVDWNVIQAILRRSAHTMEACFLSMQTSALMALLVASSEALRRADNMCFAQWVIYLLEQVPFLLMSLSSLVLFFKAAAVTEKCTRVPPLVNSQLRSEVCIDHERQYAVAYIKNSAAGFYVKGVRLTTGLALKLTYLLGVLILGLVAQIARG